MIGMRYLTLAFAALALAAAPGGAAAQTKAQHHFAVGGKAFTVPVPEGYCLPSGPTVELARGVAALDTTNFTHANFDRCGTFGEDYVHIKSPRQSQSVPIPRADFIALIARELQTASGQQLVEDAIDKAGRDVAEGTGNEIQLDNTVPSFFGQDDVCAYMAMSSDVVTGGGHRQDPRRDLHDAGRRAIHERQCLCARGQGHHRRPAQGPRAHHRHLDRRGLSTAATLSASFPGALVGGNM